MQQRLLKAGFGIDRHELGSFGPATADALRQFQRSRGLLVTGTCDGHAWRALVEAGYQLGDRLLYLRSPMVRGDDVEALQGRLGALGFDAGRVDAIFGPNTERALKDFQRNTGLTIDGVCGPEVLASLERLGGRTDSDGVAGVRERERMRRGPTALAGRRVVVGEHGGLDVLARSVAKALHDAGAVPAVLHHPDPSAHAQESNAFDAELYIGLAVETEGPSWIAYYATRGFRSEGGATLAEHVHHHLGATAAMPVGEVEGLRLPVLRETRMPAVVCFLGPASTVVERSAAIADAVTEAVKGWTSGPIDA